jgi:hypothetical protein
MSPAETTKAIETRSRFRGIGAACSLRCASNSFIHPMAYTGTRKAEARTHGNAEGIVDSSIYFIGSLEVDGPGALKRGSLS